MYPCFDVDGIAVDRLLHEWRGLAREDFSLLAVNAFGDLFLEDPEGTLHRLDITAGEISQVANSAQEFRDVARGITKKKDWFLSADAEIAGQKGYGKESAAIKENLYVADLCEYVSFMGALHHQISDVPDGGQIRMKIGPKPEQPSKRQTG